MRNEEQTNKLTKDYKLTLDGVVDLRIYVMHEWRQDMMTPKRSISLALCVGIYRLTGTFPAQGDAGR